MPSSASSASAAPTAKNPSGSRATIAIREASTRASGASESGAISASAAAYSGGLRVKNATTRSRGVSPARSPNAAPTENAPTSRAGAETSTS